MTGIKCTKCPKCGGEIVMSEYFQYSHDFRVLPSGRVSKKYTKSGYGSMEICTAACRNNCGAHWEDGEFSVSADGKFIDYKYLDGEDPV